MIPGDAQQKQISYAIITTDKALIQITLFSEHSEVISALFPFISIYIWGVSRKSPSSGCLFTLPSLLNIWLNGILLLKGWNMRLKPAWETFGDIHLTCVLDRVFRNSHHDLAEKQIIRMYVCVQMDRYWMLLRPFIFIINICSYSKPKAQ